MRVAVRYATLGFMPAIRLIDSITELSTRDAGCLAFSGSHGGISSARFAADSRPLLSVFNDAGMGKDDAGIAGLAWLQTLGLAGCAVSHTSACIGIAQSTFDDGIISHANEAAHALGVRVGQACKDAAAHLQRSQSKCEAPRNARTQESLSTPTHHTGDIR